MSKDFERYGPSGDETFSSPYEAKPEPERKSGCFKALIISVIVCFLAMITCCAGSFLYIRSAVVTETVGVQQLADNMLDWQFNDELPAVFGLDLFLFKMAMFVEPDRGIILVLQSRLIPDDAAGESVEAQIRSQMKMGSDDDVEETIVLESEDRTLEVRGQEVDVTFNRTEGRKSGNIYWEVIGVLPGEPWPVVVFLKLRADEWSDKEIEERLKAIR